MDRDEVTSAPPSAGEEDVVPVVFAGANAITATLNTAIPPRNTLFSRKNSTNDLQANGLPDPTATTSAAAAPVPPKSDPELLAPPSPPPPPSSAPAPIFGAHGRVSRTSPNMAGQAGSTLTAPPLRLSDSNNSAAAGTPPGTFHPPTGQPSPQGARPSIAITVVSSPTLGTGGSRFFPLPSPPTTNRASGAATNPRLLSDITNKRRLSAATDLQSDPAAPPETCWEQFKRNFCCC